MRVGISICSNYRVDNPRDGARFMIERATAARHANLDSLFVGDQHNTSIPYYQNTPMLGRMLAEWNNKPAGALYLLPLWHPVVLAEQIGTLAAIMPGRFILQCGLGGGEAQFAGVGSPIKKRVSMFEAALNIMQALWRGETVTHEPFWNIKNARISPVPAEAVEVWVGSVAKPAIERTARMADGWLASPSLNLQDATTHLRYYLESCAQYSKTPSAVAIRKDIFIGASSQEAQQVKQYHLDKGYRGMPADALLVGSVNEVVDELGQFASAGFTDVIVRNMSQDQSLAIATIERLGDVVQQLR